MARSDTKSASKTSETYCSYNPHFIDPFSMNSRQCLSFIRTKFVVLLQLTNDRGVCEVSDHLHVIVCTKTSA